MSQPKTYKDAYLAQTTQTAIAGDQLIACLLGFVSIVGAQIARRMTPPETHMADETISAMLYRKNRDGKFWGWMMRPVDIAFSLWQRDDMGNVIHDHCYQAHLKERNRRNLPDEYRT